MLQFLCKFAFVNFSIFQTGHRKITQILKVTPHTACQHGTIQQRIQNFDQSLYDSKL